MTQQLKQATAIIKKRAWFVFILAAPTFAALIVLVWFDGQSDRTLVQEVAMPEVAHAAAISWDGDTDSNGDGISWDDQYNWSTDTVPTAADDVTIDADDTIRLDDTTTINSLTLGNVSGTSTSVLQFSYDAITDGALIIDDGNLVVHDGSRVDHATSFNTTVAGNIKIDVQSGDITINSGGRIYADSRGYAYTFGDGYVFKHGGSYGGQGGRDINTKTARSGVYGSIDEPVDIGSSGFGDNSVYGGGAIYLTANSGTVTINGEITADGASPTTVSGLNGGGSGGSVYISASTVAGTGEVTANGGHGYYREDYDSNTRDPDPGGGGGRVAIHYDNFSLDTANLSNARVQAYGGPSGYLGLGQDSPAAGGAGTIYLKDKAESYGDLIIDNNDIGPSDTRDIDLGRTPLEPTSSPATLQFKDIYLQNEGNLDLNSSTTLTYTGSFTWNDSGALSDRGGSLDIVNTGANVSVPNTAVLYADYARTGSGAWSSLTVDSGGTLTHTSNDTTQDNVMNIETTGTMTINGTIDVEGKGFRFDYGTGAGNNGTYGGGGGGHGGEGGTNEAGIAVGGSVYGSIDAPTNLGSGGACTYGTNVGGNGGFGGGAVQLTVGTTFSVGTSGSVNADGGDGKDLSDCAGGAGGSVYIDASTISGTTGTLSAAGGNGVGLSSATPSGGGGGRISLVYDTLSLAGSQVTAYGGGYYSRTHGGAGTIYLKDNLETYGDLVIDNDNSAPSNHLDSSIGLTPLEPTTTPSPLAFKDIDVQNKGNLEITSSTTLTYSGTFTWSDSGILTDNSENTGSFSVINAGAAVTVPNTAILYANTPKTGANAWASLTVDSGGTVTHTSNDDSHVYDLDLETSGNITINGSIDADGKGYSTSEGTGAGSSGSGTISGGSYGGEGGNYKDGATSSGPVYGSISAPIELGSGGGCNTDTPRYRINGGGAIKLVSGNTVSIGSGADITADGANPYSSPNSCAGPSGGSIYIDTGTLSGTGSISVDGGNGGTASSLYAGGGGGRVAVIYDTLSLATSSITAYGGRAWGGLEGRRALITLMVAQVQSI